jgi:hypothetical protein
VNPFGWRWFRRSRLLGHAIPKRGMHDLFGPARLR